MAGAKWLRSRNCLYVPVLTIFPTPAKRSNSQHWAALPNTLRTITAMLSRITGKSGNWAKSEYRSVLYTKTGQAVLTRGEQQLPKWKQLPKG